MTSQAADSAPATATDVIASRLFNAGCRFAFGIPGGEVIAMMDVTCLVNTIEHKDPRVRTAAAEALGKLSPEVLATNAALVAKLEDADANVAQTLGKLALEIRAAALVAELPSTRITHSRRMDCLHALGKFAPDVLAPLNALVH